MAEPSAQPSAPSVEAAEWLPSLGGARVVRARGPAAGEAEPPVLVVLAGGAEHRVAPLPGGRFGRGAAGFRGTFLVPAEVVRAGCEAAWLEWPDGARAPLPDPGGGEVVDREVLAERRARRTATAPPTAAELEATATALARAREEVAELERAYTDAERLVRAALEDELDRRRAEVAELTATLEAERAAHATELGAARAAGERQLAAARGAREADATALAAFAAELEAERAAHAVARSTVTDLRAALANARRDLAAARRELADSRRDLAAQPPDRPGLAAPAGTAEARRPDLGRLAREQAVAAAQRTPSAEVTRVVADLDAAAAALRRTPPAERRLRRALVSLAREDAQAAGRLIVALLPAQAAVLDGPLAYDLTIRGLGSFGVTVAGDAARVTTLPRPRPRRVAAFHLTADPLALAELLAGEEVRIGRLTGRARLRGSRRALRALDALPQAGISLAEAARAGARLEPGLVFRALAHAIDPEWTRGHAFTVAQRVESHTWYLTARPQGGLAVASRAPGDGPDATVAMPRDTFDRLLRAEPPAAGARPVVRGDRAAVALLKAWTDRAAGR